MKSFISIIELAKYQCRQFLRKSSGTTRLPLELKIMVGLILTIIFPLPAQAQQKADYPALSKYRNWSVFAGPVIYDRATLTPQYGDYTFENKPISGFNAGFEYDFYPDKKWSFVTGFYTTIEPVYNLEFTIKQTDIYSHFYQDYTDHVKKYSIVTFSSPLLLKLNIQTSKKSFASFLTGFKVMYFPHGSADMVYAFSSEELSESREVFGLNLESPENSFQGSFVVGTGFSYALDKVLLKTNLIYVMNFQNTISGEYQFANMLTSPDTRGYYDLSGNYLGFLFSVSLRKGKSKPA